ncbi:MAG TPA: hypothetical protein VFS77_21750, partial [Pyrinomonadaceae bacterium]|nr:hypothetical protein [Pyrinomonadaceae bacterium]
MAPLRSLISSVLIVSLLAPLLGPQIAGANVRASSGSVAVPEPQTTDDETGLQFRLSQGVDQPDTIPATALASASELSQSEIENIVKRLPSMTATPSGVKEFS